MGETVANRLDLLAIDHAVPRVLVMTQWREEHRRRRIQHPPSPKRYRCVQLRKVGRRWGLCGLSCCV